MKLKLLAVCFLAGMAMHAQGAEKSDLPNVLIIGDSISMNYTKPLKKILKGKAKVSHNHNPENACDTARGLKNLDKWLGSTKWDVIHFNFRLF